LSKTEGVIGEIITLVKEAAISAIYGGTEKIEELIIKSIKCNVMILSKDIGLLVVGQFNKVNKGC